MTERDWLTDIRRFRRENGLTQHELATFLGVSQKTVSRWERGADQPSLEVRRRLERLLRDCAEGALPAVWEVIRNAVVPLALVDGRGQVLVASKSFVPLDEPPPTEGTGMPTVLVVEDDEAVLKATRAVLKRWQLVAVGVPNGEAALRMVAEDGLIPDMAIIDFRLPGAMNGIDTANALRQIVADLPILIVSGEANAQCRPEISGGMFPFVTKPVDPEEIRMILMSLLPMCK